MELLQGENLHDLLNRRGRLDQDEAVHISLHILDALDAAHGAAIIHRDLKPENVILVRGPGGEPWAKIIDFGIARLADGNSAAMRQTAQGVVMGTPYYMSPEQARNASDLDVRTDVYAAGVMLFEMVTGQLPYDGNSLAELLTKVLSQPFPTPRSVYAGVTTELEQVILKATARKRDDRFPTAAAFADALRPLRGEMVAVRVLSPEEEEQEARNAVTTGQQLRPPVITPPHVSGRLSSPPPRRMTGSRPNLGSGPPRTTPTSLAPELQPGASPAFGIPTNPTGAVLLTRKTAIAGIVGGGLVVALVTGFVVLMLNKTPESEARSTAPGADAALTMTEPPAEPDAAVEAPATVALASSVKLAPDASAPNPPGDVVEAPAEGAATPDAAAAAPPTPTEATITLAGLPPDAEVTINGELVGSEFRLPISDTPYELRVVATGRRPFAQQLRVTQNTTIFVTLLRGSTTPRLRDAGTDTPSGPAPVPDAGSPRTDTGFVGNPFATNPFADP
jgi:serine/threonine-protein kinase